MIEPPSKELLHRLLENRLCSRADLRRCRRRVRKLARDLPAFDCVWIDALQQLGRITPFQAKLLHSPDAANIAVGPCVLLDRLGSGLRSATYLARTRDPLGRCVLKKIEVAPPTLENRLARLEELTSRLRDFSHDSLVAPHAARRHNAGVIAISRHVGGATIAELLVRRGRFGADAVAAIARRLVDALAAFESEGCVHGDIRTANVRLTSRGDAVLVDAGINPAVFPELIVDPRTPPEQYDGIAGELIGTGAAADSASDMYALGCLLWQLLAGRPVYPTGDPLARLAAHQTKRIVDIREWAPDTPAPLAEAIMSLTSPEPGDRPPSFRELRDAWGRPRRSDRRRLARFHSTLHARLPARRVGARASAGFRRSATVAALVVVSAAALTLTDAKLRNQFLDATAPIGDYIAQTAEHFNSDRNPEVEPPSPRIEPNATGTRGTALPAPNAKGVVELNTNGPYVWNSQLNSSGTLTVRGAVGRRPVVLARAGRCGISAVRVEFENLNLKILNSPANVASQPAAAIEIKSQSLSIRNCRLDSVIRQSGNAARESPNRTAASFFSWTTHDTRHRELERLTIADSVCYGSADVISVAAAPIRVECSHCLIAGGGRLLHASNTPAAGRDCLVRLKHVTLRGSRSLLRVGVDGWTTKSGSIDVEATNCVFDFQSKQSALFHLTGNLDRVTRPLIRMSGVGSLSRSDLRTAARAVNATDFRAIAEAEQWVQFDGGILAAPFRFAGSDLRRPADSAVIVRGIPRRASGSPGIDAGRLTRSSRAAAN